MLLQADSTVTAHAALFVYLCAWARRPCASHSIQGHNDSLSGLQSGMLSSQGVCWWLQLQDGLLGNAALPRRQQLQVWLRSNMRTSAWQANTAFQDSSHKQEASLWQVSALA